MTALGAQGRALRAWLAARPATIWLLIALALATMLLGGGSRDDIRSLLILRPFTAIMFVLALALALPEAWVRGRALVILGVATLTSVLVQLLPLPAAIWSALGGREPIVTSYEAAAMALPALPLSLTPSATWNAAFALLTPLAALVLALTLGTQGRMIILRLLIAVGLLSGLIGLLQTIDGADSALYFYRHTNEGSAVGLFANRNHQALLIAALFPMLAANASLVGARRGPSSTYIWPMTLVLWAFLAPLLLVTGSRAGIILGFIGLLGAFWIRGASPQSGRQANRLTFRQSWLLGGLVAILCAALVAVTTSRATAVQRLFEGGEDELRLEAMPAILRAILDFFPWGSGYGSFADVYRIYEPARMLGPNYLNHAHNDVVELLLTGGMLAALLLSAGLVMLVGAIWKTTRISVGSSDHGVFARMAAVVAVMLVLASFADYPLRTPSLALFAAIIVAIWARALSGAKHVASDFPSPRSAMSSARALTSPPFG